jgi:hypothetical protein
MTGSMGLRLVQAQLEWVQRSVLFQTTLYVLNVSSTPGQ